jgi:hypothetical protein
LLAATAQEVSELVSAPLAVGGGPVGGVVSVLGGDVYYQDKPLSCTWIILPAEYTT